MRTQDLTADAAVVANFANQQKGRLPGRIGSRAELDDVAGSNPIRRAYEPNLRFGASSGEEAFKQVDFVG